MNGSPSATALPAQILRGAVRNIVRAKLRNSLTIIGIAIGTTLLVLLIALLEGIQGIAERDLLGSLDLRSVTIFTASGGARPTDGSVLQLRAFPGVEDVRRRMTVPVTLALEHFPLPIHLQAAEGGEPEVDIGVQAGDSEGAATVPVSVAKLAGFSPEGFVGQVITVRPQRMVVGPSGPRTVDSDQVLKLRVVGIRSSEDAAKRLGGSDIYVSLKVAVEAMRLASDPADVMYSSLVVLAATPTRAVELVGEFAMAGYGSVALKKEVDQVMSTFAIIRLVLFFIGGIAVVVAALGVVNTMLMAVLERTREIGILKSIGATNGYVRALFLAEAAVLGASGSLLGAIVGSFAAIALGPLLRQQLDSIGGQLSRGALFVVTPELLATAILGGSLIAILAAWLPSERAARLEPAAALRYE